MSKEWQFATQTHCGNVRSANEDAYTVNKAYPLLVVADGMGGHEAGEVASQMLVDALHKLNLADDLEAASHQVSDSILQTNTRMIDYARDHLNGRTAGTTVVSLLAQQERAVCVWAGDSRLYRLRASELEQLSDDHSYVAELVRKGEISEDDAKHHPSSNIITRAVGASADLQLESKHIDLLPQDTYLLCSDGLYNEVADEELQAILLEDDIHRAAVQLLNLGLSREARDNITFIIARVSERSGAAAEDETLVGVDSTLYDK